MLQQTRVETAIPYYKRWMEKFPNIYSLSNADERDVFLIWEGLGYYRRAKNLLKAARIIQADYCGEIPEDVNLLKSLPGIGTYTANAIASIAFRADTPAIDGNIRRIISRVLNLDIQADLPPATRKIKEYLNKVMPSGKVGDFNQALMDLGSAVCKPANPECSLCPLMNECISYSNGNQNDIPILKRRQEIPVLSFVCAVINSNENFIIVQRIEEKLLGGLWEFPNEKISIDGEDKIKILKRSILDNYEIDIRIVNMLGVFKHSYTHFKQIMFVYRCDIINQSIKLPPGMIWSSIQDINDYPMGKIFRDISKTLT